MYGYAFVHGYVYGYAFVHGYVYGCMYDYMLFMGMVMCLRLCPCMVARMCMRLCLCVRMVSCMVVYERAREGMRV